jgi:hypothetical protein
MAKINVTGTDITIIRIEDADYISLTDMAKANDGEFFVSNWLRNRNTLEYIEIWEQLNNPDFNYVEFDTIKSQAGLNRFRVSAKDLIEKAGVTCLQAKTGRYGGTYAHKDLAFHFGMWISPRFQLLMVKEFQRLKEEEQKSLGWSAKRELAKINYHIHTDAIKHNLIPAELTAKQTSIIYASEADVLNMALFGVTAKDWRDANPNLKGNIRDYATINELICLSNMENLNAVFINEGLPQRKRLVKLNQSAIQQMRVLAEVEGRKLLK